MEPQENKNYFKNQKSVIYDMRVGAGGLRRVTHTSERGTGSGGQSGVRRDPVGLTWAEGQQWRHQQQVVLTSPVPDTV